MGGVDGILATLRELEELPETCAKRAAPLVEEALRATAAAGTDPSGKTWEPKKDGGRPLVRAAEAIRVKAIGTVLVATLSGPTVFHHFGGGRNPRRPVLPDPGTIPPLVGAAVLRAGGQAFDQAVKA